MCVDVCGCVDLNVDVDVCVEVDGCVCGWATIVEVDEIRTDETNRLEAPRATISPRFVSAPSCLYCR